MYYDLLSKCLERTGDYKKAFISIVKRNEIKKNLPENVKFEKKIVLNLIQDYKKYFVKKNIKKFSSNNEILNNKNLTFLVGFPRSGTTLLDTILRTHSKIDVLEEKPFISNIRDNFFLSNNSKINSLEKLSQSTILKLQKEYYSYFNLSPNKIIMISFH